MKGPGTVDPACLRAPELQRFCCCLSRCMHQPATAVIREASCNYLQIIWCRSPCVIHRCSWLGCFSLTACSALMFHGPYHWRSALQREDSQTGVIEKWWRRRINVFIHPSSPYKTGTFYDVYCDQSLFSALLTKVVTLELFYFKLSD